jgi:hypothetical protein
MASRKLNDLAPEFRPLVVEFLARCVEAKIPVLIVETRRTEAEHQANVAAGKSWTSHSKHIDGLAIDVAPYKTFELAGKCEVQWNADAAIYQKLGALGELCGLKWGGRWQQKDLVHFEMS